MLDVHASGSKFRSSPSIGAGQSAVSVVLLSLDDSHSGCWHVMFASCCISGAGDFDTSICTVPMVIRKYSSVRNKYWPEDQQVNFDI